MGSVLQGTCQRVSAPVGLSWEGAGANLLGLEGEGEGAGVGPGGTGTVFQEEQAVWYWDWRKDERSLWVVTQDDSESCCYALYRVGTK